MNSALLLLHKLSRPLERFPLTMILASVLLACGIVQLSFQIGNMVYRTTTWIEETRQTELRVNQLKQDIDMLKAAKRAANDPVYLEQLARCQGYVRAQGEMILFVPEENEIASKTAGYNCQSLRLP